MTNLSDILLTFSRLDLISVVDILLVALIIYGVLMLLRGTRAMLLVRGALLVTLIIFLLSNFFRLTAFNWLMSTALPAFFISIPVIFQPEIRRALERLGRPGRFFGGPVIQAEVTHLITHICRTAERLKKEQRGGLIVLEGEIPLDDVIATGVRLDSVVSTELLVTIFDPHTTLHDGAVVIRGNRIAAAACVLPMADEMKDRRLGMRHRAAVGITESTDAVAVVVSEETGTISLAYSGRIIRHLDDARLSRLLHTFHTPHTGLTWGHLFRRGEE
jgi:diadenylate cyclase